MSLAADQMSQPCPYRYQVYGLTVDSRIEIPELTPADELETDISVKLGHVPDRLTSPTRSFDWIEHDPHACLFRVQGIGRFLIENGNSITIDRRENRNRRRGEGAPPADLRVYLLGSAFGALLHQRGWVPLHVSAVQTDLGVWSFTGDSGAGKSTTVGWLHRRYGWPIVSDDVSVLKPSDPAPNLYPGPRKLKLWQDAVDHLECHDEQLVQDLSNTPKFQLYLSDQSHYQPRPMQALVILDRCDKNESPSLERLTGTRAFEALMGAVYRPYMAEWFREPRALMQDLVNLCNQIDVYRFRRQWSLEQMEQQLEPVLNEIKMPKE